MAKKILDFFLFSSLFISVCAVIMGYQTATIFSLNIPFAAYYGFVFFATACSYNFHWYLSRHSTSDKTRSRWTRNHSQLQLVICVLSGLGAVFFFLQLTEYWLWIFIAAILTFLYSAPKIPLAIFKTLKTIAVGKTIFLSFVWVYVTTILPLLMNGEVISTAGIFFVAQRFFLIYAICIIFDYRDKTEDVQEGIKTLITFLPEKGINRLFYGSLAAFLVYTILLYFNGFSLLTVVLLVIPGIITLLLYNYSKRNHSDYLYYGVLDGLMMASALFTSLPWID